MKVSEGCKNCYAETLAHRYGKQIWGPAQTTGREIKVGIWKDAVKQDEQAPSRRRAFVSSMSDFLEDHPQVIEPRERAKELIRGLKNTDVLLLTKRPENAEKFLGDWYDDFPAHVWIGTTVENQAMADKRIHQLLTIPAKIHFLSVEPMLEKIDLELRGMNYGIDHPTWSEDVNWVICGGESGAGCRPFEWNWARDVRDQCHDSGVAFWMKQGGGHPNKREKLEELPEDLRIRELPKRRGEE